MKKATGQKLRGNWRNSCLVFHEFLFGFETNCELVRRDGCVWMRPHGRFVSGPVISAFSPGLNFNVELKHGAKNQ